MKYIKTYNESIRHFLSPKKNLSNIKKPPKNSWMDDHLNFLSNSCRFNMVDFVKEYDSIINGKVLKDCFLLSIDNSSYNVIEYLLTKGVNSLELDYATVLSCSNGDEKMLKILLKNGAKPETYGTSPLKIAKAKNFNNIINILKDYYSKILDKDEIEKILNESIKHLLKPKDKDYIIKQIEHLSDFDKFKKACQYGALWLVKYLIQQGIDPSFEDNIAIRIASHNGYLDIVKELLKDQRVDPSINNNYAIDWAIMSDHKDVAKELLKDQRVINKLTPFKLDLFKNKLDESIKHLLKPKPEEQMKKELDKYKGSEKVDMAYKYNLSHLLTNQDILDSISYLNDWKKFKLACRHNMLWLIKILFKDDVDDNLLDVIDLGINISGRSGSNDVMSFLSDYKNSSIDQRIKMLNESIKHLLKPKNINDIKNFVQNLSPQEKLYHACKNDLLWLAEESIKEGADINGYNTKSCTPLIDSIYNNSFEVFKFLLKNGADIKETRDLWEQNALELVVYYGKYEYIEEILKYKPVLSKGEIENLMNNINVTNIYGNNYFKIEKLLKNYFNLNNL